MGTRADFYVGRGKNAEWVGSIAWDGYPDGIEPTSDEKEPIYPGSNQLHNKSAEWPKGGHLFQSRTEADFRERVEAYFKNREDVSRPADGWPWPWATSATTDYAYAFDDGKVWISGFGRKWLTVKQQKARDSKDDPPALPNVQDFPNMKDRMNVQLGSKRSGLMVFTTP